MDDVTERVRRELERIDPSAGYERTLALVGRRRRSRRLAAGAVGLMLSVAVAAGLWTTLDRDPGAPAVDPSLSAGAIPTGDHLILTGDGEAWVVDVEAATSRHVVMPELSPGDPPLRVVRRGDRLVAWGYRTLVLDPSLAAPPRVLAEDSWIFIPSAVEDRVWVGVLDPESPDTVRALQTVREMTVDGEVTVPDTRTPGGRWPIAAVNQGLILEGAEHDGFVLWDPRTGEVVDLLPGDFNLAARGDAYAWCSGGEIECDSAHLTDFATGGDLVVVCPAGTQGFQPFTGAFSPDGSTLALALRLDWGPDSRRALTLIDVATGELDVVNGTNVEAGYVFVEWTPSGDSVFISGGSEERQLIEYRPAEGTARAIPVEVGDFYGMAAI